MKLDEPPDIDLRRDLGSASSLTAALLPPLQREQGLFHGRRPVPALTQPVCCLAIDAEEDFDWHRPVHATGYSTHCMRRLPELREILRAYGIRPTFLLTYPVLDDPDVVALLRRQHERGDCEMGIQLHPWVTPPFLEPSSEASYLGRLHPAVEERKLLALMAKFRQRFGFDPVLFRAGRYGLSNATSLLLEKHGFLIDTSVAPHTDVQDDGGPDFSTYECEPFWFGRDRLLLEVPLCRSVVGWGAGSASRLYHAVAGMSVLGGHLPGLLSRLRFAERVTLTPEGNDVPAMLRLLRHRRQRGQTIFTLSFHSSSLAPGRNPYVRSRADLHLFYDRLSEMLDIMASRLDFSFASLSQLPALLGRPAG